jgi:hypothetical protein
MDRIQSGVGYTYRNVTFRGITGGNPANRQHQDLIQLQLGYDPYVRIIACEFIDGGDSQIELDTNRSPDVGHLQIYNNISFAA